MGDRERGITVATVISDTAKVYIELDEDANIMLLAYDSKTNDQEIHDAWNLVNDFGHAWVKEEYWDEQWQRYVAICVKEKPE
jgi:hypothetical protein